MKKYYHLLALSKYKYTLKMPFKMILALLSFCWLKSWVYQCITNAKITLNIIIVFDPLITKNVY